MGEAPTSAAGGYGPKKTLQEALQERETGPGDTELPISLGQDIGGPAFDIMDYDFSEDDKLPKILQRLEFLEKYYDAIISNQSKLTIKFNYFTKEAYFGDAFFSFDNSKFIEILVGNTDYVTVGKRSDLVFTIDLTIGNSQGEKIKFCFSRFRKL